MVSTKLSPMKCSSCGAKFDSSQLSVRYNVISCKCCGTTYAVDAERRPPCQIVRRRGTAIVDTPKGILVVAGKSGIYLLPGGEAHKNESRMKAAVRELREETGLRTRSIRYLFTHHDGRDRKIRNLHKVFLIEAEGIPRHTSDESEYIDYWRQGSTLPLGKTTRFLVEKYAAMKSTGSLME